MLGLCKGACAITREEYLSCSACAASLRMAKWLTAVAVAAHGASGLGFTTFATVAIYGPTLSRIVEWALLNAWPVQTRL